MCCFVDTTDEHTSRVHPYSICIQAAENVVSLAKTYSELIPNQHNGLIPHLTFAAHWFLEREGGKEPLIHKQRETVKKGTPYVYDWVYSMFL